MMAGRELPNARTAASAIESADDRGDTELVGAVETTAEVDEEGGEPLEMKPADKLLMVKRGRFGMQQKHTNQRRTSKDDQNHKDVKGKTTGDNQKTCSLSKTVTVTTNKEKMRC